MAIKLYGSPRSSCTQRVLMTLFELGLDYELVELNLQNAEHKVSLTSTLLTVVMSASNRTTYSAANTSNNPTRLVSFPHSRTRDFDFSSRGPSASIYSPNTARTTNLTAMARALRPTSGLMSRPSASSTHIFNQQSLA